MADKLAEGQLVDRMTDLYAESHSWEEVAKRLLVDHHVAVSGQTLRRWASELGIAA